MFNEMCAIYALHVFFHCYKYLENQILKKIWILYITGRDGAKPSALRLRHPKCTVQLGMRAVKNINQIHKLAKVN